MSSVKITGNASGTAVFEIASPGTNTNRTLTLPDATGTVVTANGSNQLVAPASGILFADTTTQTTAATAPTTATVLAATAGASVGAVGTYAFLSTPTSTNLGVNPGSTVAGSSMRYAGGSSYSGSGAATAISATSPAGTWRAMGYQVSVFACCNHFVMGSVFLRIS